MTPTSYLQWLAQETPTAWWHDSADLDELARGLAHGAVGATTNPVLVNLALRSQPDRWGSLSDDLSPEARAEAWLHAVVGRLAAALLPILRAGRYEAGGIHRLRPHPAHPHAVRRGRLATTGDVSARIGQLT